MVKLILVWLRNFSKVMGSSGFLKYVVKIKGPVEDPDVYLAVKNIPDNNIVARWKPISLSIQSFPPSLSNIQVDIELKDKVLNINKLYAEKGSQGNINISGTLTPFEESLNPVLYVRSNKLNFSSLKSEILEEISAGDFDRSYNNGRELPSECDGYSKY